MHVKPRHDLTSVCLKKNTGPRRHYLHSGCNFCDMYDGCRKVFIYCPFGVGKDHVSYNRELGEINCHMSQSHLITRPQDGDV